ncbi:MAG TPA: hypothetical protein DCK99_00100 [Blastocatellia bacterium]|nr:hypothetical protein [Blastocatellia bacterium]
MPNYSAKFYGFIRSNPAGSGGKGWGTLHDFIMPVPGSRSKIRNPAAAVTEAGDAPALQLLPLRLRKL